jgi:hypothetical protein
MILNLLDNATVANGGLAASLPAASDTTLIKQFAHPSGSIETKLRASGPDSSSAWQRTVLFVTTGRKALELVAQVALTNVNWQATPQIVLDPSSLWAAVAPGNGTWIIGGQSVTISGDTEIATTGATNGLTGINASVERN